MQRARRYGRQCLTVVRAQQTNVSVRPVGPYIHKFCAILQAFLI